MQHQLDDINENNEEYETIIGAEELKDLSENTPVMTNTGALVWSEALIYDLNRSVPALSGSVFPIVVMAPKLKKTLS